MDIETRVQILDEAVCILHSTNTYAKSMHRNISSYGEIVED